MGRKAWLCYDRVYTHTSAGNSHFLFGVPGELQLRASLFYLPVTAGNVADVTVVHRLSLSKHTHKHTHISSCRAPKQTLGLETWFDLQLEEAPQMRCQLLLNSLYSSKPHRDVTVFVL